MPQESSCIGLDPIHQLTQSCQEEGGARSRQGHYLVAEDVVAQPHLHFGQGLRLTTEEMDDGCGELCAERMGFI